MRLEELLLRVELERIGSLLLVSDVRRRSSCHEHGSSGHGELACSVCFLYRLSTENQRLYGAAGIRNSLERIEVLSEGNTLLEGFDRLFMVESIGRRIDHALPVGDSHASP